MCQFGATVLGYVLTVYVVPFMSKVLHPCYFIFDSIVTQQITNEVLMSIHFFSVSNAFAINKTQIGV